MSAEIWLALIVAFSSSIGPLILAVVSTALRNVERRHDYARQDAVAAQAAVAAKLLIERQDEVAAQAREAASLLLESNKSVAATAAMTNQKLDIIHTLVNSNMTAAMQAEFDATVRELAMMREVVALNKAAGREPHQEALSAILATSHKIEELKANLDDRLKQTKEVKTQTGPPPD